MIGNAGYTNVYIEIDSMTGGGLKTSATENNKKI
jgi:hypothetical protein